MDNYDKINNAIIDLDKVYGYKFNDIFDELLNQLQMLYAQQKEQGDNISEHNNANIHYFVKTDFNVIDRFEALEDTTTSLYQDVINIQNMIINQSTK